MVRSNYYTQPYRKELEVYTEFSGGMNSFAPNGDLRDNELALIKNKDLGNRGSFLRRYGMVKTVTSSAQINGQGYFRYYRNDGTYDEIEAVNGYIEMNGIPQSISGLTSFQTTRPVEAAQVYNKLYIATGTKLVVYDGTNFSVATPYLPTALEGLYYGFNALLPDPVNFMSDSEGGTGISASGVTFNTRYGLVNTPVNVTGVTVAPAGWVLEYKLEYRTKNMTEGTWTLFKDWNSSKIFTFTPTTTDEHQFKFTVRQVGQTVESFYQIPKYTVKAAQEAEDISPDVTNIHGCNRILVHYNRVFIYGDSNNNNMVYVSHNDNPLYFPVPNCLRFDNPKNEALNTIIHYRDKLVAMTDTSIQALHGKSPADFQRVVLNTQVGCIAPLSAVVVENFIYFLSQDGVYYLKQVGTTEDRANVAKLDTNISNIVPRDKNACGTFHNLQYHLVFPNQHKRFRFYNELNAWVMDDSPKLDFVNMYVHENLLYAQSKTNGNILKFDSTVFNDDGHVYEEEVVTKSYNFNQPYHPKTMRELLIYLSPNLGNFKAKLNVYVDGLPTLESSSGEAVINEDGYVTWDPTDKDNLFTPDGTRLGEWKLGENPLGSVENALIKQPLNGKGLQVKLTLHQDSGQPNEIFGFAFIFKVKKPK